MRKLLFIIAILLSFGAKSQTFTPIHNYQAPDGLAVQKYAGIPHGDTATFTFPDSILVSGIKKKTPNLLFQESDSTVYVHWGKWIAMKGSGGSGSGTDSTAYHSLTQASDSSYATFNRLKGVPDTLEVIGGSSQVNSDWNATSGVAQILNKPLIFNSTTNGIVDPLLVTWSGTGLVFDISAGSFIQSNVRHYVTQSQVTLSAADVTYPRIDAFYIDTLGNTGKITGVASANPVAPQVSAGQFLLTTVYLNANATVPSNINVTTIYDENTEWTTTSSGTGTVNYNNTVNPYHLTKAILVSSNSTGFTMTFTNPSGIDTAGIGDVLKFFLYTATNLPHGYTFQFFSGTNAVSTPLSIDAPGYGFNPNNYGTYQNVSIPLSAFTFFSPQYNAIKITSIGANTNPVYWDYIQIQKGLYQFEPTDYSNKLDSVTNVGGALYQWAKGSSKYITALGGVQSVTGNIVDNTDPLNPVVNTPTLQQAFDVSPTFPTPQINAHGNPFIIDSSIGVIIWPLGIAFSTANRYSFSAYQSQTTLNGVINILQQNLDTTGIYYLTSDATTQSFFIFANGRLILNKTDLEGYPLPPRLILQNIDTIPTANYIAAFDGDTLKKVAASKILIDSTVTLSSGTITVSDPRVHTGARIFISCNTPSGTVGFLSAKTSDIIDGTSFIINSSSALDNSTVNYEIINQ